MTETEKVSTKTLSTKNKKQNWREKWNMEMNIEEIAEI
jgi:hypothetical protein